ncbi:hypothetical protein [Rhodococcoides fascians]|uniref:hypothetical protein n=1 Tax=Rhodococcoides fascians TaxID=1828 RepID=UPI00050CF158|nr:hypothetical protein [Rhodococcus fascians]
MTNTTPFPPGALRQFFRGNAELTALVAEDHITTRELPDVINAPFVTLAAVDNSGEDPMLRDPVVQLDVWVPKWEILGGEVEPEELAWNIADLAGRLAHTAHPDIRRFRNCTWKARWSVGPLTDVDLERGPDLPLYRALVRWDLKMVVR